MSGAAVLVDIDPVWLRMDAMDFGPLSLDVVCFAFGIESPNHHIDG